MRRHLPLAIGIVLVGLPICGLATFVHFVLGVPLEMNIPVTLGISWLAWDVR